MLRRASSGGAGPGPGMLAAAAERHPDPDRPVHAVGEHRRHARLQRHHLTGLGVVEVHRGTDQVPVVGGREPVHHLERGVLDHVADQLRGDLLGDHQPLAVGADLGQHRREQLDRVGAGPALPPGPQQPVGLLDDNHMTQPRVAARPAPRAAGAQRSG